SRNLNDSPQCSFPRGDGQLHRNILAIHFIQWVGFEHHFQVKIARLSLPLSSASLTGQTNMLSLTDTLGDTYIQGTFLDLRSAFRSQFSMLQHQTANGTLENILEINGDFGMGILSLQIKAVRLTRAT